VIPVGVLGSAKANSGGGDPTVTTFQTDTGFAFTSYSVPEGTTSIVIETVGVYAGGDVYANGGYARGTLAYTGQTITCRVYSVNQEGDEPCTIVKINGTEVIGAGNGWDNYIDAAGQGQGFIITGGYLTSTYTEQGTRTQAMGTQAKVIFSAYT
jgi:hypothetical protein